MSAARAMVPWLVLLASTLAAAALHMTSGDARAEQPSPRTAKVEALEIDEPLVFDGRIEPLRHAEVSARIEGVVSAIHFSGGQIVSKGDLLFELAPKSYEAAVLAAQANLDRAEATLRQMQFVLDQQSKLRSKGVASELRYQEAVSEVAVAKAELAEARADLMRAELELARTKLTAPIDGRIGDALVALGSFVEAEAGRPLARIVQLDPMRVLYNVPYEQRLQSLARTEARSAEQLLERITVELELPGGVVYPSRARPTSSSAEIDPDTGAVKVSASVSNPDLILLPGLPVKVRSSLEGARQSASKVPSDAVRMDQAGAHVLVVHSSGLFERRAVTRLRSRDGKVLVAGVFEGEAVVTEKAFQPDSSALLRPDSARRD